MICDNEGTTGSFWQEGHMTSVDWIKMRKILLTDPRVVRISSALDADRFRTLGGLFSAWCLLDDQTVDGVLQGYTAKAFDEVVGIPGIANAMQSVGWLAITTEGIAATEFEKHNGKTAKRRAQENVRKMSARDADKQRTKGGQNKGQDAPQEGEEEEDIPYPNPSCNEGGNFDPEAIDWDMVINRASWLASELKCKPNDRITVARIAVLMQTTLGDEQVSSAVAQSRVKKKPISYFITVMKAIATQGGWDWDATTKAIIVHGDVLDAIVPANSRKVAT